MKFREHRSTVDESMETLVELKDWEALIQHCQSLMTTLPIPVEVTSDKLEVTLYADFPDTRIDWDKTYLVTLKDWGPVGFTDSI